MYPKCVLRENIKPLKVSTHKGFNAILLWGKVSNLHEAVSYSTKFGGRPRSNRYCYQFGSMLRLSCYPHPRDKGACLPKFHHPTIFDLYRLRDRTKIKQFALS